MARDRRLIVWVAGATVLTAVAWFEAFDGWIDGEFVVRYDMAEPFIRTWTALTWISLLALGLATLSVDRIWISLAVIGAAAIGIQALIGVSSAWIGVADGTIGRSGALLGAASVVQIGLSVVWIVLLARSRRAPA